MELQIRQRDQDYLTVSEIDSDNKIALELDVENQLDFRVLSTMFLTIEETKQLVAFLQKQIEASK